MKKMFRRAFSGSQHKLLVYLLAVLFALILIGSAGFYLAEHDRLDGYFDAVWWAVVTLTTVGYGDIVPHEAGGKLIGLAVILVGVVLTSVTTAMISTVFISRKLREERGLSELNLRNHIILCGFNTTAVQLLSELLNDSSKTVVMINNLPEDEAEELIYRFKGKSLRFVKGDFITDTILERASVSKADTVIIVPDESGGKHPATDDKTILAAYEIKAMNPKVKIFAHVLDADSVTHIKKAQVDDYIVSDNHAGYMLSRMVTDPGVPQSLKILFDFEQGQNLRRVICPQELCGKTFKDAITYYRERQMMPIGIVRETESLTLDKLLEGDNSYLDKFIQDRFSTAGKKLKEQSRIDVEINPSDSEELDENLSLLVLGE